MRKVLLLAVYYCKVCSLCMFWRFDITHIMTKIKGHHQQSVGDGNLRWHIFSLDTNPDKRWQRRSISKCRCAEVLLRSWKCSDSSPCVSFLCIFPPFPTGFPHVHLLFVPTGPLLSCGLLRSSSDWSTCSAAASLWAASSSGSRGRTGPPASPCEPSA